MTATGSTSPALAVRRFRERTAEADDAGHVTLDAHDARAVLLVLDRCDDRVATAHADARQAHGRIAQAHRDAERAEEARDAATREAIALRAQLAQAATATLTVHIDGRTVATVPLPIDTAGLDTGTPAKAPLTVDQVADDCIAAGGWPSTTAAARHHGCHHSTVRARLRQAVADGRLREITAGGPWNATRWEPA